MAVNEHEYSPSAREHDGLDSADRSDLDPAAFLKSVRELSDKRDREDAERFRKLEEEVQKGRAERAARRADRARSISPEKQAASPRPLSRTTTTTSREPQTPTSTRAPTDEVPEFKGFASVKRASTMTPTSASAEKSADAATTSAAGLARSGTLTWNRRPQSQLAGSRPQSQLGGSQPMSQLGLSRPQSVADASTGQASSHRKNDSVEAPEPTRDEIAAQLGARDPSWFRQTADRGIGSAAYRKSKEDAQAESITPGRMGLPGLSRESTVDPENQTSPPTSGSIKSDVMSRASTISTGSRFSAASSASTGKPDLKALIAEDEDQHRASPAFDRSSLSSSESSSLARTLTMSSSQARLAGATDRPLSPTKGMGGFVQSAMMKRSDSQIKRWSAQPSSNPARHNPVLSALGGQSGLQGSHSMPKLEPTVGGKESINESSRPTSSSNDLASLATAQEDDVFVKPALPRHNRSKSGFSNQSAADDFPVSPGSPSKRFSPTKSSWLESSLTKPESPKPAPSKNTQPSWMADLASRKAQRASAESTPHASDPQNEEQRSRPGSPTKQTPFGQQILRRSDSTDLINKPLATTSASRQKPMRLVDKFDQSPGKNSHGPRTLDEPIDLQSAERSSQVESKPVSVDSKAAEEANIIDETQSNAPAPEVEQTRPSTFVLNDEPSTPNRSPTRSRARSVKSPPPPPTQEKAHPGVSQAAAVDFRSQLKSRPPSETKPEQQPEFLAKFGQLRKAQTEKFVAPDVLKDNILRGKSGLAQTGGPVKSERRDELKESLLAKKNDMQMAKEEGRDLPGQAHERKISGTAPSPPAKPEALAKRELLGRSEGTRVAAVQSERVREGTPEALARHKSLRSRPTNELPKAAQKETPEYLPEASPQPAEVKAEPPSQQISASSAKETSGLAARFNPGLANMLARGPSSQPPSKSATPVVDSSAFSAPSHNPSDGSPAQGPLTDVRKDRARGPKRRKGRSKSRATINSGLQEQDIKPGIQNAPDDVLSRSVTEANPAADIDDADPTSVVSRSLPSSFPAGSKSMTSPSHAAAQPGSMASVMEASLRKVPRPISIGPYNEKEQTELPGTPKSRPVSHQVDSPPLNASPFKRQQARTLPSSVSSMKTTSLSKASLNDEDFQDSQPETAISKPITPAKSPALLAKTSKALDSSASTAIATAVPDFRGFASAKANQPEQAEENKENSRSILPSVKPVVSLWGRQNTPQKAAGPSQIHLPTKKDEEAAMRSAGLLAASPKTLSANKSTEKPATPLSAGAPPRPSKPSRVVSGQLAEASPNKCDSPSSPDEEPKTEAGRLLAQTFGVVPKYQAPLAIDTSAIILASAHRPDTQTTRNVRTTVLLVHPDGTHKPVPSREEYIMYDQSALLCTHVFINDKGSKAANIFLWTGTSTLETTIDAAHAIAKGLLREYGSVAVQTVAQGRETAAFINAVGGILITRRGSPESATRQFVLCVRKHLDQIVVDEVDFRIESLCAGFAYIVAYPVTLLETKVYLWKGLAHSTEELSAARLAAMDLNDGKEVVEVDSGMEPSSFLTVFGANGKKWTSSALSELWKQKAAAPDKFHTRMYKVQQAEVKTGLMTAIWNRRPSWNSLSPARSPSTPQEEVKVEVKEIVAFTQSQLEAECVYLLDSYGEMYILIGPLFNSQPEKLRTTILGQTLLLASNYAVLSSSIEDRPSIPKCWVLFSGVPRDVKMMFRHWDEQRGLWGTGSLMAGERPSVGREVNALALEQVLNEVCRD